MSSSSYNSHAPLQSTLSAPPVHRISSASHLGPRSSLVAEADYHHRLHRSLSSSPSAHSLGDSEPLSGISGSNGSLINIPADESYVYTPPKAGMRGELFWAYLRSVSIDFVRENIREAVSCLPMNDNTATWPLSHSTKRNVYPFERNENKHKSVVGS